MRVRITRRRFSIAAPGERVVATGKSLQSHLDQQIIEFLNEYFNAMISFTAQYYRFKSEQKLQLTDIESLVENHVFFLRQISSSLFQQKDASSGRPATPEEQLLHLIIGSIFHELLRLKQYLYILETHQTQMALLEESLEARYFLLRHGRALVREAEMKLPSLMEELRELWEEANTFLHQWLPQFGENRVILRFLFRNQILIDRAYGYRGFENVLSYLFEHGAEDGFFRMGMDYYRSSHFVEAAECFGRFLDLYDDHKNNHSSALSDGPKLPKSTRVKRLKEISKAVKTMLASVEGKTAAKALVEAFAALAERTQATLGKTE